MRIATVCLVFSLLLPVVTTRAGSPDHVAILEPAGPSSRRTQLVFSEIMYHPQDREDGRNLEFVELSNPSPFTQSLDGYRISGAVDFAFAPGATIAPFGRLVVAAVPADIEAVYGISGVLGPWVGGLSNASDTLRLRNALGSILLEVEYSDVTPWPAAPDGGGPSLELHRPSYGENHPHAWGSSRRIGGTPGSAPLPIVADDPLTSILINEVLVHTDPPLQDHVELYNVSTQSVDLAGWVLTDSPATNRYVFPSPTVIGPGQHLSRNASQFGFALSSAGESLFLVETNQQVVVDAVTWPAQRNGWPYGRVRSGSPRWAELAAWTPGWQNSGPSRTEVVINELMYNPLSGQNDDEYVELFNRSAGAVDLSDWRLAEGVNFRFPAGTVLPAGGYLVIARNQTRLLQRYPHLSSGNTLGNYGGSLANSGERIRLLRPDDPLLPEEALRVVDEVDYRDGGRWDAWADAGGSSLELIDPNADNFHPDVWAASDETSKAVWTLFETNAVLDDLDNADQPANEVQLILLGAGECLVDNLEVLNPSSQNLVTNGTFESGLEGWVIQGNHIATRHHPGEGAPGSSGSMLLSASDDGDNGVNRVETDLSAALSEGSSATLRVQARWLRGMPRLLVRINGNYIELSASLPVPEALGTPGLPNSRLVANAGPVIHHLRHDPLLPAANGDVVVTARIEDPDGLASTTLEYAVDGGAWNTVVMHDLGTGADRLPGDGVFTGLIPGQADGTTLSFRINATDNVSATASRGGDGHLIRIGQALPVGDFHSLALWMTPATLQEWEDRQEFSNELLPGTLVLGNYRVLYDAGARYRGSPFIRVNYDGPVGSRVTAYVFRARDDDPYLGVSSINLDGLEQDVFRDTTLQRERMSFWIAEQCRIPSVHQRYVHVYVNGVKRGQVYADTQQPNRDFLKSVFPDEDDGPFFEIDDWFEFDDQVKRTLNRNAQLVPFENGSGELQARRYRWSWQRKDAEGVRNDEWASTIFDLVRALEGPESAAYEEGLRQRLDLRQWLGEIAVRRVCGDWDGYGFRRGKNTSLYRPPGGKWWLLIWDMDFSLGANSVSATQDPFLEINDPAMQQFLGYAPFTRRYWSNMLLAVDRGMNPAAFDPVSEEIYSVLTSNGLTVDSPLTMQLWVADRRASLLSRAAAVDTSLAILSNGGSDFSTANNPVTLVGTAPLRFATLAVNGNPMDVTWVDVRTWSVPLFLAPGANAFTISGLDELGQPIPSPTASITITSTTPPQPLENLVFTELMYNAPEGPDFDFIELKNVGDVALDLSGMQVADGGGVYVFETGVTLPAGALLVLAADGASFAAKYPGVPHLGSLPFNLSNGGETVYLRYPNGTELRSVTYSDDPPWPAEADGGGYSLVSITPNPAGNQDTNTAWQLSCALGGSPAADDPGNVAAAPSWVIEPESRSVLVGESATFSALATACPPPVYQWFVDFEEQPGATTPAFPLDPTSVLDTGAQVFCVASNLYGAITSEVALLTVTQPVNARHTDCLVAYYLFDEGSGTVVHDQSGFGVPLDLDIAGSGVTWLSGNGVSITSNSSLQSAAGAAKLAQAFSSNQTFSVEMWMKAANTSQSGPARLLSFSSGTATRNFTLGQSGTSLEFRLRTDDASTSNNGLPATVVTSQFDLQVHHLLVTWSSPTLIVYRDGVAVATNTVPGGLSNWNSTYPLVLANETSGDRPWLGEIYLAALYCQALDAEAVQQNYQAGYDAAGFQVDPPELPEPELSLFTAEHPGMALGWDTFTNAVYRLQWSPGLAPPDWRNLGPAFMGTGSLEVRSFTNSLERSFFRAMQFPQP